MSALPTQPSSWLHWAWPGWSTLAALATLVTAITAIVTVFFTLRALRQARESAAANAELSAAALAHAADQAQRDQYRSMLIEIATLVLPSCSLPDMDTRDRLRALVTVMPADVAALPTIRATFNIGPRSWGPLPDATPGLSEDQVKEQMLDDVARAIARINDRSFPVYLSGSASGTAAAHGDLQVQPGT